MSVFLKLCTRLKGEPFRSRQRQELSTVTLIFLALVSFCSPRPPVIIPFDISERILSHTPGGSLSGQRSAAHEKTRCQQNRTRSEKVRQVCAKLHEKLTANISQCFRNKKKGRHSFDSQRVFSDQSCDTCCKSQTCTESSFCWEKSRKLKCMPNVLYCTER